MDLCHFGLSAILICPCTSLSGSFHFLLYFTQRRYPTWTKKANKLELSREMGQNTGKHKINLFFTPTLEFFALTLPWHIANRNM